MESLHLGKQTARNHKRVRRQHQSEITQDYVEAIYRLKEEGKGTRVTDIQGVFGVSHVTVIRTLARLEEAELLVKQQGSVTLTDTGREIAVKAYRRHNLVMEFLRSLGVSEKTAAADTEGIEHHLSEETVEAIQRFLDSKS
ncbi:MAG: iron dependent repressor, metal binding and dimerization domain protein [Puniceicoccaceae bacterium]